MENPKISYIQQGKINPKRPAPYYKPDHKKDWDSLQLRLILKSKRLQFCKELRHARIVKGISQTDLARNMGVNQNYISRIESGKINISFDNLIMMAYYLDMIVCLFGEMVFDRKKKN
jgi:ribosome-binding protein aMBF1 (putative translation factor)